VFGTQELLEGVVQAIAAHTDVWAGRDSSLPDWLSDHFVNQFSHLRGFIFDKNGSMRELEANDCPDLDSVHNDYQRCVGWFLLLLLLLLTRYVCPSLNPHFHLS